MNQFEPLLTADQAGELLKLPPRTVMYLARAGRLPARKVGRYWRFRRSWLEAWLEDGNANQAIPERHALAQ